MTDLPSLWSSVASAASGNPEVMVPSPRKWSPTRLKQAAKVHAYLDGDWAPLIEAVRTATTWGAPCRLDLSLERLTSKDCERLDSLLSGKWRREENQKPSEESKLKEQEDGIIASIDASTKAYGRYSDSLDDELKKRAAPKKPDKGAPNPSNRWVSLWNEIRATTAPGAPAARSLSLAAEKSLLERASALGLDPAGLEAVLREKLPIVSDFMRQRVMLVWLATGKSDALEGLLNGKYDDEKLAKEQAARERRAAEERAKRERDRIMDERVKATLAQMTKGVPNDRPQAS